MKDEHVVLRGVIDRLEGDWAVIVFDDEQRLDWPRERLPEEAKEGMAVVLGLERAVEIQDRGIAGTWEGAVGVQVQAQDQLLQVQLGKQSLSWPAVNGLSAGDTVVVRMHTDAESTEQRRQRVQALVDDLFG